MLSDYPNTSALLERFGKEVRRQARSNLTRRRKRVSDVLYKSIDYEIERKKDGFFMDFVMEEYGEYQDKGVSGKERKYNTPYKFTNKMPPRKDILRWVNRRRMRLRDPETGRFKKGGQNSLAFLIQRAIFRKGIRPSLFFTRAFENAFRQFQPELEEAYANDVEQLIEIKLK